MKKIFALCSVILCFALIVTVFTACDGNKNDGDTSTTESNALPSAVNGDFLFTAEIKEDSVVIKNNGGEYQVLKYPQNSGVRFDLEYAKGHYDFIDMNFDGIKDFYVATSENDGVVYCHCWLFNDTTKQFDYSPNLSALPNISVDSETHTIYSEIIIGDTVKVAAYGWVDGKLALKDQYEKEEDVPDNVGEAVSQNAIGVDNTTDKKDEVKETQSNKKDDTTKASDNGSSSTSKTTQSSVDKTDKDETVTKEDKPLDTTTTEPATGGIVINDSDIDDGWF